MKHLYLIFAILISSASVAQQRVFYFKRDDRKAPSRDSALYIRTVTEPEPGSNLFSYTEAFTTGEVYRTGKTTKADGIIHEGEETVFYLSGKKQSTTVYENLRPVKVTVYYPNGIAYLVKQYNYIVRDPDKPKEYSIQELIISCNDSTGKSLVTDGNGRFVLYTPEVNPKFKNPNASHQFENETGGSYEEGNIKNGMRNGEWKGGSKNSLFSYTEKYDNGKFISGKSVDKNGKRYSYSNIEQSADFRGGVSAFGTFLSSNIKYPHNARLNRIQGKVFATFIIDKDGSLTDIKIARTPDQEMGAETLRVLGLSPKWQPGTQHGIPVRQQFTIPVIFALPNGY